jgi:formyl-CoA transferase
MPRTNAPLSGVTVVEFGNLIAAPYAGMLLADLGAEVVKVEPPSGDLGRSFGPYVNGESAFFLASNRGKRSVVVDFRTEAGLGQALEFCTNADVVINNLRPGAMERFGLSEEEIRAVNPTVVYGVVSAFGADGPYADRSGIDVVFQGEAGMMSITGDPGSPPGKTATTIGDYVAGTNLALAVCAALVERVGTGRGRRVDVSLRDGLLAVQGGWMALAFATDEQPPKTGTASPYLAPNQAFETADGWITIAIVSDRQFAELCDELGRPDLLDRYPSNDDRMAGRVDLVAEMGRILSTDTAESWIDRLAPLGIPIGRVRTLPETWTDPQVEHNEMVVTYDHPVAGSVRAIGSPLRIDGEPAISDLVPPTLGADGDGSLTSE